MVTKPTGLLGGTCWCVYNHMQVASVLEMANAAVPVKHFAVAPAAPEYAAATSAAPPAHKPVAAPAAVPATALTTCVHPLARFSVAARFVSRGPYAAVVRAVPVVKHVAPMVNVV